MSGKSLCMDDMISETFQWNYALYLPHELWRNVYSYTTSHEKLTQLLLSSDTCQHLTEEQEPFDGNGACFR